MTATLAVVPRTVFATSRAAEFLDARSLQAQTGRPRDRFGDVVIKELVDNALDAAESAGVEPEITVRASVEENLLRLRVTDNGAGIAASVVERILDFNVLVSDKAAYRSPSRGLQGNAWKTVLGIAQLDTDEPVVIEAHGIRHQITVGIDPGGHLRVDHHRATSQITTGTVVTVTLPSGLSVDVPGWMRGFALINPHATISWQANSGDPESVVSYKPTVSGYRKPVPTDRLRPHWYDETALRRLVFAHIGEARAGGRDLPVGEFVRTFEGLSSTAKAKAVKAAVPCVERLSDFEDDPAAIGALLQAMKAAVKVPKTHVLGEVPDAHYRACLHSWYGVERFWFKRRSVVVDGLPWVIEVAAADTTEPGRVFYAVNYSPGYGDPLGGTQLRADDVVAVGAGSFLHDRGAIQSDWREENRAAVVHIITPAPEFLDKGKVQLDVPAVVADEAAAALAAATKELKQEKKRHDRDARQESSRREQRRRQAAAEQKVTVKDATFAVMAEAVAHVSGDGKLPIPQRNLFYAVRDRVQRYDVQFNPKTGQDYFRTLLTQYQQEHGPIPGLYYDPRGELREPHTGKIVRLGTREVAAYEFPSHLYDKILYVEKEGFGPVFEAAQLAERFDLAVASGKGQPVEAVRALFERAQCGDYRLFVLHDADPYGYSIARTIAEETARMPGYSVDVIDLGLSVADALDRGLTAEDFTRRNALPHWMPERLNEREQEWFEGRLCSWTARDAPKQWACRRVELNAFTAPELITYIEDGLAAHGATGKVIPPTDTLTAVARDRISGRLRDIVGEVLAEHLDLDALARQIAEDHSEEIYAVDIDHDKVANRLTGNPPTSWDAAVDGIVGRHLREHDDPMRGWARAALAAAITGGDHS